MNGPKAMLVPAASATCGRDWEKGNEFEIAINADHSSMVKFSENDRDEYGKVSDVLHDFVQTAATVIGARLSSRACELHAAYPAFK